MEKKILVINQGHTDNYGDVAINDTICNYFKSKEYEVSFYPFFDEKIILPLKNKLIFKILKKVVMKNQICIDFCNRLVIKNKIKKFDYDAVIIGGGELLCGHKGFNSSLYFWTKYLKKINIPVYLIGVSGDINMSEKLIKRNKKSLELCKYIWVRDGYTKKICNEKYKVNAVYAPDVVLGYNKICKSNNTFEVYDRNTLICVPINYSEKIKLNLNLENVDAYIEYISKLIEENLNCEKIIITVSVLSDEIFAQKLYSNVKDRFKNIKTEFVKYTNLEDYIKLTKKANYVISGRMHALIIAGINGCKVKGIPFKEKLKYFNEEYGNEINISSKENEVYENFEILNNIIKENFCNNE